MFVTSAFLCPEAANKDYRIEFLQIKFRNLTDGLVFFESPAQEASHNTPAQSGTFYYDLGANFLRLGSVGVSYDDFWRHFLFLFSFLHLIFFVPL